VNRASTPPARYRPGLAQRSALAILRAIGRGHRTVSEIIGGTGLSQSNVSNHLARFRERQWVQAERSGRQIRYHISDPALAEYIEQIERAGRSLSEGEVERLLEEGLAAYVDAARLVRPEVAEQVIDELLDAGVSWQDVTLHVFAPALQRVGDLWERDQLSVAAEHAATAFTQQIMSRLAPRVHSPDCAPLGMVVVACVAGELHSVGPRMVADFFEVAGWKVRLLGADVPPEDLLALVRELRPDMVALSATVDEAGDALRQAVRELGNLRRDTGRPLLMGGGQWFDRHPEHGLPLDLWGRDLPSLVAEAGHRLVSEEQ
jgi:methanogenic corrinoid protein MtbC1